MGKVASSSIYHSLKNYPEFCYAFHTHNLNPERIQARNARTPNNILNPDRRNQNSEDLGHHIIEPGHPAKIITLVRDPFARNISAFFENSTSFSAAPSDPNDAMEYLRAAFFEETNLRHPDHWFQEEFNRTLQLDIFAHPYDPEQGWRQFSSAPYDVLVLSTELPDEEKAKRVSEFVGIPGFQLERRNTSPPGGRKELYEAFKAHIRFPEEAVDEVLNTRYAQHFFDAEIREAFRERWQSNRGP